MALGDIHGGLEGRRYSPVDGEKTNEGPEDQSEVYERTNQKNKKKTNNKTDIDMTAEYRKGQLRTPFVTLF